MTHTHPLIGIVCDSDDLALAIEGILASRSFRSARHPTITSGSPSTLDALVVSRETLTGRDLKTVRDHHGFVPLVRLTASDAPPFGGDGQSTDLNLRELHQIGEVLTRLLETPGDQPRPLQAVSDRVGDGIVLLDADGTVIEINQAASAVLGSTRRALLGRHFGALVTNPSSNVMAALVRALKRDSPMRIGLTLRGPAGRMVRSIARLSLFDDAGGRRYMAVLPAAEPLLRSGSPTPAQPLNRISGLLSERTFLDNLNTLLGGNAPCHVAVIGIDALRRVTAALGLRGSDELVQVVARLLLRCAGDGVSITRIAGDEFAVVAPRRENITELIDALQQRLTKPLAVAGTQVYITCSMGVALRDEHSSAEGLVHSAAMAALRARERGGGRLVWYSPELRERAVVHLELESALRSAIDRDELEVHYQPLISVATRRIVGFEALVRWPHPELGLLGAGHFVPVAERTGLIGLLGRQVLRKAAREAASWPDHITLSVNATADQFTDHHFVDEVRHTLRYAALPAQRLKLEVTETILMNDTGDTQRTLSELRALGVRLCVDDFGTGYSSLSFLRRFPVDELKVDRSFLPGLHSEPLVPMIVALGHALGLSVTAEGVEHPGQLQRLADLGCQLAQGFLFSKPVPASTARRLLMDDPQWRSGSSDGF